ncbi:ribosomal protein S7e [Tanacetum coccineum]
MSTRSRSMSTYQMRNGTRYTIRAARLEDYQSVIQLQQEELRQDVSDTKLLQDAQVLADRFRGGYQCLVARQSDQTADAYVDRLVVRAWARRNGIGTNLMESSRYLLSSSGHQLIVGDPEGSPFKVFGIGIGIGIHIGIGIRIRIDTGIGIGIRIVIGIGVGIGFLVFVRIASD